MLKTIVGIKDEKIGYINLLTFDSEGQAIRSFGDACTPKGNKEENDFVKFPKDFNLMSLGTFDTETGEIRPYTPRTSASATQYQGKENE
ncbi:MAG: hypothetical protein LBJ25_00350 [Candidatus Margulisbacteria bacterium]|jgi:hypothetical protein|nr:hypothetical protein [Candidatus Margulisiibacteriota bacterium]